MLHFWEQYVCPCPIPVLSNIKIGTQLQKYKCINFMLSKVGAHKSLLSMASVQWKLLLQLCPDAEVRNLALNIRFLKTKDAEFRNQALNIRLLKKRCRG